MITSYDLGIKNIVEETQKLKIDELVRQAKKDLKIRLILAEIEVLGVKIELTSSKTRFNGERLWFICPQCGRRVGILHNTPGRLACRHCLGLRYKNQKD